MPKRTHEEEVQLDSIFGRISDGETLTTEEMAFLDKHIENVSNRKYWVMVDPSENGIERAIKRLKCQ